VVRRIFGALSSDNVSLANGPSTFAGIASLFVRAQGILPLNTRENNFDTQVTVGEGRDLFNATVCERTSSGGIFNFIFAPELCLKNDVNILLEDAA
jgi:hypothetical protein